jgi:hypothetical protein
VFVHYQQPHSSCLRTIALDVMEFIRRVLQHVLPTGFMTVRYYGFLSPTSSMSLEQVRTRIEVADGFVHTPETAIEPVSQLLCRHCGGPLVYRLSILPHQDRTRWVSSARPSARLRQAVPSGSRSARR